MVVHGLCRLGNPVSRVDLLTGDVFPEIFRIALTKICFEITHHISLRHPPPLLIIPHLRRVHSPVLSCLISLEKPFCGGLIAHIVPTRSVAGGNRWDCTLSDTDGVLSFIPFSPLKGTSLVIIYFGIHGQISISMNNNIIYPIAKNLQLVSFLQKSTTTKRSLFGMSDGFFCILHIHTCHCRGTYLRHVE